MTPYILLILLSILLVLVEYTGKIQSRRSKNVLFFTIVLYSALMTGFRDMIGGYDIYLYGLYFKAVPPLGRLFSFSANDPKIYTYFEPGYLFINSLIRTLTTNKYTYFMLVALVSYGFIGRSMNRYEYPLCCFFLFLCKFFIVGFIYTRQFIALAFVWWGFRYVEENKKLLFFVIVMIATLVHYSALIVVPLVFIANSHFSSKQLIWIFGSSVFIGVTGIPALLLYYAGEVFNSEKLLFYADLSFGSVHPLYLVESMLFAGIVLLVVKDKIYGLKRYHPVLNALVMYVILSFITLRNGGALRLTWYFYFSIIVFIPYLINHLKKRRALLYLLVILYFTGIYFRNVVARDDGNFIPYKAFFIDTERVDKFENVDHL